MKYTYRIEDGQFSNEIDLNKLLGDEGDIIKIPSDDFDFIEAYILYIEGNHVECIGNVYRSFPKNSIEHNRLKISMQAQYSSNLYSDFKVICSDEFSPEIPKEIIIGANTLEEAKRIFQLDYPNLNIMEIESV